MNIIPTEGIRLILAAPCIGVVIGLLAVALLAWWAGK